MEVYKAPALGKRAETGPMQFGDDWPGVFIRGDHAMSYAHLLRSLQATMESGDLKPPHHLKWLINLLEGCIID